MDETKRKHPAVRKPREPGQNLLGLKEIPADFDDPDPEIEALFYDGPIFPDEPPKKPRRPRESGDPE